METESVENSCNRPVFIISSGRSGTTLLRLMLNAGNELHIPHESDFVARAFPIYGRRKNIEKSEYQTIVELFRRTSQNAGWGLSYEYLLEYLKEKSPTTFYELNICFVHAYLDYHELTPIRWGIKAPVLIANIDRILEVFPDANIVHLVRDGRDVSLSYRAVHDNPDIKAFGPGNIFSSSLYWVDGLRRINKHSDRIYELKYEELLSQPDIELRRLCEYLDISYDPMMHEAYHDSSGNKDALLSEHKKTIHAKINQGLDVTNKGKYKYKMTRANIIIFELLASPYLVKYGYEIEHPMLNSIYFLPFRKILYTLARIYNDNRYSKRDRITFLDAKRALNKRSADQR